MHFDFINCILEFIFNRSYFVGIRRLSCITDDENGFNDCLVSRLSLVFAGLILILLFFSVSRFIGGHLFL
jgi:hypothetical protein